MEPTTPVVLVVDDEPHLLDLLRLAVLLDDRFAVIACKDGPEAVRVCQEGAVDAMVLDLMMPGMSGIDVLVALGSNLPPTMVLSAIGDQPWTVAASLAAGARTVMAKPFDVRDLLDGVVALLGVGDV